MKNFRTTKIGINDDERIRRAATFNRPDFFVVCSKLPELSRLLLPECEEFRVLRTDRLWCDNGAGECKFKQLNMILPIFRAWAKLRSSPRRICRSPDDGSRKCAFSFS
jgi:hypothetical protein